MKTKSNNRKKMYGIVLKDTKGKFFGYIDASLTSMGWSEDSIMIRDLDWCQYHMADPGYRRAFFTPYLEKGCQIFIVRIHSKTCPIMVNMGKRSQRQRNHSFITKANFISTEA